MSVEPRSESDLMPLVLVAAFKVAFFFLQQFGADVKIISFSWHKWFLRENSLCFFSALSFHCRVRPQGPSFLNLLLTRVVIVALNVHPTAWIQNILKGNWSAPYTNVCQPCFFSSAGGTLQGRWFLSAVSVNGLINKLLPRIPAYLPKTPINCQLSTECIRNSRAQERDHQESCIVISSPDLICDTCNISAVWKF